MAIIAAMIAVVTVFGEHLTSEELLLQQKSSDQWAFYQAKSIRRFVSEATADTMTQIHAGQPVIDKYVDEAKRYRKESDEVQKTATELEVESRLRGRQSLRIHFGEVFPRDRNRVRIAGNSNQEKLSSSPLAWPHLRSGPSSQLLFGSSSKGRRPVATGTSALAYPLEWIGMNCSNCGLANADTAKFCANCGTTLGGASMPPPTNQYQNQSQYQAPPQYQAPYPVAGTTARGGLTGRNIAIGCLILLAFVLFFGLSCTRACFGLRHRTYVHRRY